jgi:prepilin peptidase CpaA
MKDAASLLEPLVMLATSPRTGVLVTLLLAAAVIDYRSFRIPNWLTLGGMVLGLACSTALVRPAYSGLLAGLGGIAVGMLIFLPLYAIRVLGAGDVKLMGAAGAFLGTADTLRALLFIAIAGGVAAVAVALRRRALRRLVGNLSQATVQMMAFATVGGERPGDAIAAHSVGKLPYGISICAGTIAYLVARQLVSA